MRNIIGDEMRTVNGKEIVINDIRDDRTLLGAQNHKGDEGDQPEEVLQAAGQLRHRLLRLRDRHYNQFGGISERYLTHIDCSEGSQDRQPKALEPKPGLARDPLDPGLGSSLP